ncbi:hypothetical protein J2W88_002978 [Acidovorax delafieldii]|uniref:Uncharacterized protein n=1 Tax=Acidovorax delafieldii TaxID=47920 RepID=A0AAJ2C0C8_ACIDE|nr:hypothetical protein [Acidovorax delafieldii]MDR6767697.1 hypothetical protein [Acidovorax delafieldii]MDR6839679.1 hypothetical protein [Acidovorax delafieldii]MDR7368420.1 hypothetical protein [Acidovorax delafieldii]
MNAVLEPASKASAVPVAAPEIGTGHGWEGLANALAVDLSEATARAKALADLAVNDLASVGTLLDEASSLLGKIAENIGVRPLTSEITDEAYTAMFRPMAFVQGAAAIAESAKDANLILLPSLRNFHTSLDEIQDSLGDQVLGAMLPSALSTELDKDPPKDAIQVAFGQVEYLLNHAQATEEDHDWSADSDRLIRLAHGLADEAYIRPPTGVDIDRVAFDIAALIRAARLVPGDSESNERRALLVQVEQHLRSITGCIEDCCDPGAPRPPAPSAAAEEASRLADFRECARAACYEIQSLAQAMQTISEQTSAAETHPVVHGVMARIVVLSEIVYHAAQLHGDAPMATLAQLQNGFKGRL